MSYFTDGCTYKNASYGVGTFKVGCDFACDCNARGQVKCGDLCKPPFHRKGFTDGDPLCVEQFVEGEDCCVIVTCADSADSSSSSGPCQGIQCGANAECKHEVFRGESAETICVCKEGYTGDPDSPAGCSEHLHPSNIRHHPDSGLIGCQVNNATYGIGQEWFEGCEYRCVCSEKKEILCQVKLTCVLALLSS